jgi:hypothetical protein
MEWAQHDRGDAFARSVGAALIVEAALISMSRILTFVFVVASEVNRPDEEHLSNTVLLLFALIGIALMAMLVFAGAQLRRRPGGAWRAAGPVGRLDLVLAGILNVALTAMAVEKLFPSGSLGGESIAAWALTAIVGASVVVGLVRDAAGRARPTAER